MLPKKITLNKRFCEFLRNERKFRHMSADEVSEAIDKSQGWLAQIERGRLKTIKRSDLVALYMYISGKSKEVAIEILDDKLQFIEITEKKNLVSSDGETLNFVAFLDFKQKREHLQYAGKSLRKFISKILEMKQPQLEADLKLLFSQLDSTVVSWIIRVFKDMKKTFSDEISQPNLFITIKLSLDIYNEVCSEYGLDKVEISRFDMEDLKEKLSNPFVQKEATKLKDINGYSHFDFDFIIKNFSFEEYMIWKHKQCYSNVSDKMPIVFNSAKMFETAHYVEYDDIPSDLSSFEYMKIIRHLYEDLAYFYGKLRCQLDYTEELEETIDELEELNEE